MKPLKELRGMEIWERILLDTELTRHEADGFVQGEKDGKTMDVPLKEMLKSLRKQQKDLGVAYAAFIESTDGPWKDRFREEFKQAVANVRNVAGCVFLKVQGDGK